MKCRTQTSVRAGTIFHKSCTPLTKWFLAIHLITSAKNNIARSSCRASSASSGTRLGSSSRSFLRSCASATRPTSSRAACRSTTPIWAARSPQCLEKPGGERATRPLSSSPSRPATISPATCRCAASPAAGVPSPPLQVGEYGVRQRQERHHRHLPLVQPTRTSPVTSPATSSTCPPMSPGEPIRPLRVWGRHSPASWCAPR